MANSNPLLIECEGGVLTLINNDPPINRMSFEYMDALEAAVQAASSDPDVRVLVFTAAGEKDFSVGMDLKQLQSGSAARGGSAAVFDQRLRVLAAIESMDKPSIVPLSELKEAAQALARELAGMPPVAVAGVLRCVVGAGEASLDEALAAEREAVMRCGRTKDQVEGMMAFMEKRPPIFTGE